MSYPNAARTRLHHRTSWRTGVLDHPVPGQAWVVESWSRSAAAGVDADAGLAPVADDADEIVGYRSAHPLSQVFTMLYDVLGAAAEGCDAVMALGDADGKLLWVCGRPSMLRRAERINFIEGSVWGEQVAGTNAPGTALRLDAAVQIRAGEHFARRVQSWSCAAAPIHDPETRAILGVIDVTGGEAVSSPQTLAMVRAAARMAEAELGRIAAVRRRPGGSLWAPCGSVALKIEALGRPDCQIDDGERLVRLSQRHSDIIAVLAENPNGITGDRLALEVYAGDVQTSTLRAELARLRSLLGESVLDSRPYRLRVPADCDWLAVAAALAAGDVRAALRLYRGPLLPQSVAPGVIERREQLQQQLRAAVLGSGDPTVMMEWTRSRWGADDLEMLQRQVELLPVSSPLHPMVVAEARRMDELLR